MRTARSPGHRAGLTLPAVLAAARTLLDDVGPDGLSMRALARALGVAPNALYSYVANKTELLDRLTDELLGAVVIPDPPLPDPLEGVIAVMTSTYSVLTDHPRMVPIYLTRQGSRGENAVRLGEVVLDHLERAGVPGLSGREALRVLIIHTIGSAAFATTGAGAASSSTSSADREPVQPVSEAESQRSFSLSLRWLLAGIVGRPAEQQTTGPTQEQP